MYKISEKYITVEGQEKLVYGIYGNDICIDDISPNYEDVNKLVTVLNKEMPDSIHISEIVEDFLATSDF